MSMTELERRCAFVLQNLDETWDNPSCGRSYEEIARAVLAEAGVAELVEAARDVLPTLNCMRKQGIRVDPDQVDALEAALTKIGANQ